MRWTLSLPSHPLLFLRPGLVWPSVRGEALASSSGSSMRGECLGDEGSVGVAGSTGPGMVGRIQYRFGAVAVVAVRR